MKKYVLLFIILFVSPPFIHGQYKLTLSDAINIAMDSSLNAFRAKFAYEVGYWAYISYKAKRLPTLNLDLLPFTYNHSISKQFNPADTSFQYFEVQSINNAATLSLSQSITPTGGRIYAESDLGRLENFTGKKGGTYSATPVRVGINQPIFGFNTYKWEKKIEPLKFQKAKLDYVQSSENIALETVNLYFELVFAQQNLKIASNNFANADTLYRIGEKRFGLMTINRADLLTLQLELINSKNRLKDAQNAEEKAISALSIFLGLPKNSEILTVIPDSITLMGVEKETVLMLARENNPFYINLEQQITESERDLERARIESRFRSNLDLSFGFNQAGERLTDAYTNLSKHQGVNLSLQIPLVDWGQNKGYYNLAKSQQKLQSYTLKQKEIDFEQEISMAVNEFNLQIELVKSAKEAADVANEIYEMNKQRFMLGQMDVNTLVIQLNRRENAIINYLSALHKYWRLYYNLRYITLYDLERGIPLTKKFDETLGL